MDLTPAQRIDRARSALAYYHNAALAYGVHYGLTFDDLVDRLNEINPGFIPLFGKSVGYAQPIVTEAELRSAMQNVARTTEGYPPARASELTIFFDALQGPLVNWSLAKWTTVTAEATAETAKQVAAVGLGGIAIYFVALGVLFVVMQARGGRAA